jgi:F0F1-type ATP synthase membrane subunit c/vacuolar-type H+-ATPase subunit K
MNNNKLKNLFTIVYILFIVSLLISIFSLSALGAGEELGNLLNNVNISQKALGTIGLGVAAGGAALGIGILGRALLEGIYRNPQTTGSMLVWFFVAFALAEAQVLYVLFVVLAILK